MRVLSSSVLQKGATPEFVNYEDVYYGTGTRHEKFYFTYISKW